MEKVKKNLEDLKREIVETPSIDETSELASSLLLNIDAVLENPGALSFDHHRQLMHHLEDAILAFEVGHEKFIKQLKVVIDSLNEVGI